MCLLVMMCALALIRSGKALASGADNSDNAVDTGDNRHGYGCLQECISRCQQLTRPGCCHCVSLCEKSCDIAKPLATTSQPPCSALCDVPRWSLRRSMRSPMWREAAVIARSVGMDLGPSDSGSEDRVSEEEVKVTPRLTSLVPSRDAVTAEVVWAPLATPGLPSRAPWYLVTWEPQGGGVRGTLLANTTSAALTLWPDTVYLIQVTSASSGASSTPLLVDTHVAPPHPQGAARGLALARVEDLGGVAAAVVMFLIVLLVSAVRCRGRLDSSTKSIDPSNRDVSFKQFPPPVTLAIIMEGGGATQSTQLTV